MVIPPASTGSERSTREPVRSWDQTRRDEAYNGPPRAPMVVMRPMAPARLYPPERCNPPRGRSTPYPWVANGG
eukprot:scaffold77602_cov21-Phaeocystis_antarctica.AAC.3